MDKAEILHLLQDVPWEELRARAEAVALASKGRHVFVRGLIEFSSVCKRNCLYCGLRAQNASLARYRMEPDEIVDSAREAKAVGVDTIVLQSGEGACSTAWLADVVARVKEATGLPITLSVGERSEADYRLWREAGASRYLIKHETADAALYAKLHPGYNLSQRLDALKVLRSLGYEIGSGFMIGLPGQTLESLAADIALCRETRVDMCGAGPFIPQTSTPLANAEKAKPELALRVLAALRIALPWANLPATTALATVDPVQGQINGLKAGANVLMPSFTPAKYASGYVIYDNKHRVPAQEAARAIAAAGRNCDLRPGAWQ